MKGAASGRWGCAREWVRPQPGHQAEREGWRWRRKKGVFSGRWDRVHETSQA